MSWLKNVMPPKIKKIVGSLRKNIPEGLCHKCPTCQSVLYRSDLEKNLEVCPNCNFHNRISARERINFLLDISAKIEIGEKIRPVDTLKFKDTESYKDRLSISQKNTKENDALVVFQGLIESIPVVIAVFEFNCRHYSALSASFLAIAIISSPLIALEKVIDDKYCAASASVTLCIPVSFATCSSKLVRAELSLFTKSIASLIALILIPLFPIYCIITQKVIAKIKFSHFYKFLQSMYPIR